MMPNIKSERALITEIDSIQAKPYQDSVATDLNATAGKTRNLNRSYLTN